MQREFIFISKLHSSKLVQCLKALPSCRAGLQLRGSKAPCPGGGTGPWQGLPASAPPGSSTVPAPGQLRLPARGSLRRRSPPVPSWALKDHPCPAVTGGSGVGNIPHPTLRRCSANRKAYRYHDGAEGTGVSSEVHEVVISASCTPGLCCRGVFLAPTLLPKSAPQPAELRACKPCSGSGVFGNSTSALRAAGCSFPFDRKGSPERRGPAKHPSLMLTGK